MRAAVYEGIEKIVVKEVPEPQVSPAYPIKIKVEACALCGTDVRTFRYGKTNVHPPQILGHELVGRVVEVFSEEIPFQVGDRVQVAPVIPCGRCYYCLRGLRHRCERWTAIGYEHPGALAEYMAIPAGAIENQGVNRVSQVTPAEEACVAEPLACCINGQELSQVGLGQTVVIIGGGPIGCLHSALAKVNGADKVLLFERSEYRRNIALQMGADKVFHPDEVNPLEVVLKETEGRGADVVIVASPSGKAQEQALLLAGKRGRINFFGGLPKDNPYITLDANLVHYRELFVHGSADSLPRHNQLALSLIATGRVPIKPLITHILPLEQVVEGIRLVESRTAMKVVIQP